MKFINKYLRNIKSYKVASHKIWDVQSKERKGILKLDWNEATLPPSPKVKEALNKLVEEDDIYNLYPSAHNEELISLLSNYSKVSKENVQYYASSDTLHEYLVRMYVGVGDPILILGPTYDNFRLTCESQGGQVFYFDYDENFEFDKKGFYNEIEIITPSLIYICNPNNPSGNLLERDFFVELLQKYKDTIIIVDEAYYEFSGFTLAEFVNQYDNLFVTRTFSKAFALANFRAGYLISHEENINQITKIRNPKNFNTFTQVAVIAALKDEKYMWNFVKEVINARTNFQEELKKLPFVKNVFDSYGNYLLIEFKNYDTKISIFDLLSDNDIFVRNLSHNKILKNTLRITIGTRLQMERVLAIIKSFQR